MVLPVNAAGFEGEREREEGREGRKWQRERERESDVSARIDSNIPEDRVFDPDADAVFHQFRVP